MDGWKYFDSIKTDYNINPTIEHYSCMVDLLGKVGFLDEALDFIHTVPQKVDASISGVVLAACKLHKDIKIAEIVARNLLRLEPYNSANYVLMMNIYSTFDIWGDVERLKESMTGLGMKIPNVWSWIQVKQTIHVFSTERKSHPKEGEIYFELYQLISEIKKVGSPLDTPSKPNYEVLNLVRKYEALLENIHPWFLKKHGDKWV
ncbi:Pentatricopeptide repeat-containing protein, mitochondrial [Glycine soja]|uniref:Pentatricopeptide repeat-containing protein, mitochondrial n=1 Tax=Glycine soja TaxID=3848 RepID=A0A0B2Q9P6_GLYSO|nr:Pentatricopeptide repeat-containing protein, mitochondrial [Glycine soja]